MSGAVPARLEFVERVRDALDAAGVEYAFLHNLDGVEQRDSDVDIVVDRASLTALDTVVRTGGVGRFVQRTHYDVPWCYAYFVDLGAGPRRFRQLDVVCDPYGINRLGRAVGSALADSHVDTGYPVAATTAQLAYLASKRAWKGIRDESDIAQLSRLRSTADNPSEQLRQLFGGAGPELAAVLARGGDIDGALRAVARSVKRERRRKSNLVRLACFSIARAARRAGAPMGLSVVLAGTDGAGKSTLVKGLARRLLPGPFRWVRSYHLTPGVLPPPSRLLGRTSGPTSQPHAREPSGRIGSHVRVGYLAADTLLGWVPKVAVPRIRSGLVVIERGWRDLEVDPRRYRLGAGGWLVRGLARVMPRPDLTIVVSAPAEVIHARKPELPVEEIERQQGRWQRMASSEPERVAVVSATDPDETVEAAIDVIVEYLARRAAALDGFEAAVRCLGAPTVGCAQHAVLCAAGRPRWIVPGRYGAPGPLSSCLYRPASARHHVGARLLEVRSRLAAPAAPRLVLDPSLGIAPELAELLGLARVELAALLPTDPRRRDRAVLSVLYEGRPVAIAKVATHGSEELARELGVLAALETCVTTALQPPRLIGSFAWHDLDVVVTAVLPAKGRTDRAPGAEEVEALVELAGLSDLLRPVLGGEASVPVHGDFCAWNTAVAGGRLAAWDWEWAHMGEPLEDWFHWQTQRLVHFGRGTAAAIVEEAVNPSSRLRSLCDRLVIGLDAAPASLAASLQEGLARLEGTTGPQITVRREALALLQGCA